MNLFPGPPLYNHTMTCTPIVKRLLS